MTFTWDATDLSTALAKVRQTIGDIDSNNALLTDEQITWRLGQVSNSIVLTSIRCVQDIIAKLARDVDRSNVGMSATRSQQITHYKDLLTELKARNATLAEMFVGGTSDDEEDSIESDSDYRKAAIKRGWGRNPG